MPHMIINLDGGGAWPDLNEKPYVYLEEDAPPIQLAVFAGGMKSGLPSVAFRFDLPDGTTVVAQTSARLFCTAARSIMAKYPNLFTD
jgi:hypothetical protein